MTTFTLELAGDYIVTSRGQECIVALADYPAALVERTFFNGLTQKIADSASGAAKSAAMEHFGAKVVMNAQATKDWLAGKDGQEIIARIALAMMEASRDSLMAGDWGKTRGANEGVSETVAVMRGIVKAALKAEWGKDSVKWIEFDALDASDQNARLETVYADNEATFKPLVESKVAERVAERARKAALKGKITINI